MVADNIRIVKQIYNEFDQGSLAFIERDFDPDIELYQTDLLPWGGRYQGRKGAASFFEKLIANVHLAVTVERLIDAGDHVVYVGRARGKTTESRNAFDVAEVHVWTLRNGKVVRLQSFVDTPAMLTALNAGATVT
jgi:ketosteroid isomerase-like protein